MKKRQPYLLLPLAGAVAVSFQLAKAQYGGDGSLPGTVPPPSPTDQPGETPIACETQVRSAILAGSEEVPIVQTAGSGTAVFGIRNRTEINFALTATGLTSNITAAHIHIGSAGENGPVIFPLSEGPFSNSESGVLTESNFVPAPERGINTFQEAIDAILSGGTYVNVHTATNPNGEIRGQISAVQ